MHFFYTFNNYKGGENVVYVIARLKLESYDKWKPVFDERKTLRKEAGSKEALLLSNFDNPKEIVIFFDWENMESARKFFESESLKKALQKGGAKLTETTYLEEIEKTT
jgi:heme-degrading monooxygenase HmoA